jgi:hypothetical protein
LQARAGNEWRGVRKEWKRAAQNPPSGGLSRSSLL